MEHILAPKEQSSDYIAHKNIIWSIHDFELSLCTSLAKVDQMGWRTTVSDTHANIHYVDI